MARLTIEDKWWTDPRRSKLIKLLGGEDEADLAAVRLWKLAQGFWGNGQGKVPIELFEVLEAAPKLIEAKLATIEDAYVYVKGSREYLNWLHEKRIAASEGGKKSAESRRNKTGSAQPKGPKTSKQTRSTTEAKSNCLEPSGSGSFSGSGSNSGFGSAAVSDGLKIEPSRPPQDPSPTALTWRAYRAAYETRYKTPPTWNKRVGGQLKQFTERVPLLEAPFIAAFYLTHNGARYVGSGHAIGPLLQDAEKLRTEWQTGRKITSQDARSAEFGDSLKNQIERLGGKQ